MMNGDLIFGSLLWLVALMMPVIVVLGAFVFLYLAWYLLSAWRKYDIERDGMITAIIPVGLALMGFMALMWWDLATSLWMHGAVHTLKHWG